MTKHTWLAILITALVVSAVWIIFDKVSSDKDNGNQNQNNQAGGKVQNQDIIVDYPTINAQVQSPLVVTGQARGGWYFEASFPMSLLDANGNIVAQSYVQAQGDWMTNDFVPFSGTIQFPNPPTATGTLILEKDNPSGLPQFADQVLVPVQF